MPGKEHSDGIVAHRRLLFRRFALLLVDDAGPARFGVLPAHVGKLLHDDLLHARGTRQDILKVFDLALETLRLLQAL